MTQTVAELRGKLEGLAGPPTSTMKRLVSPEDLRACVAALETIEAWDELRVINEVGVGMLGLPGGPQISEEVIETAQRLDEKLLAARSKLAAALGAGEGKV